MAPLGNAAVPEIWLRVVFVVEAPEVVTVSNRVSVEWIVSKEVEDAPDDDAGTKLVSNRVSVEWIVSKEVEVPFDNDWDAVLPVDRERDEVLAPAPIPCNM